MNRCLRIASACVIALALAGCAKKPIVVAAPPLPPPTETVNVPPPTHPTEPLPEEPLIVSPSLNIPATTPVKPPSRPRLRPAPNQPTEAMLTPPAGIADLGQLTTGGESNNEQMRRQTDDLLKTQNRRLSSLPASVIAAHRKQVEQARLYLKQAGDAWNKQDIEGARTLGTKAKVILDEIQS